MSTETDADSGLSVQELIDMAKKELEKKKAAVVRKKSAANAPGQITNTQFAYVASLELRFR